MNIKEILVATFLPAIKTVGILQLTEIFAKIKANHTEKVFTETLRSIHATFSLLQEAALKTKTKIDDGLIETVLEAVRATALENDIPL